MNAFVFLLLCFGAVIGWSPVAMQFFKAWKERKNPISLAIFGLVILSLYTSLMLAYMHLFKYTDRWAVPVIIIFHVVTCFSFHLAFHRARSLPDTRKSE